MLLSLALGTAEPIEKTTLERSLEKYEQKSIVQKKKLPSKLGKGMMPIVSEQSAFFNALKSKVEGGIQVFKMKAMLQKKVEEEEANEMKRLQELNAQMRLMRDP